MPEISEQNRVIVSALLEAGTHVKLVAEPKSYDNIERQGPQL